MFSSRARKIRKDDWDCWHVEDPSEDPSEDPEVDAMNEVAVDEVIEADDVEGSDEPIEGPDESDEDPLGPGQLCDSPCPGWPFNSPPYEYKVKKTGLFFICSEKDHKKACAEFLDFEKRKSHDAKKKEFARRRVDYQTAFEMRLRLLAQDARICKKHK